MGEVIGGDDILLVDAFLTNIDLIVERFETANDTDMSQEAELVFTRVTSGVRSSGMATTF